MPVRLDPITLSSNSAAITTLSPFCVPRLAEHGQVTLGGHSAPDPPLPIPNRTVKRSCADDSAYLLCESRSPPGSSSKAPAILLAGAFTFVSPPTVSPRFTFPLFPCCLGYPLEASRPPVGKTPSIPLSPQPAPPSCLLPQPPIKKPGFRRVLFLPIPWLTLSSSCSALPSPSRSPLPPRPPLSL